MEEKKILFILYYYYPYVSGLSEFARTIAENLVKKNVKVTVLCMRYDKSQPETENINGVNVIRSKVLFKIRKGCISIDFIRKAIKLSKINDKVYLHLPMAHSGLFSMFIKKEKIITQYHCDINLGNGFMPRLITLVSNIMMYITLYRSKKILTLTKDYFSHSRFSKFIYKAIQIYPPVSDLIYKKCNPEKFKNKYNLTNNIFIVGFVGRIVYEKGIDYLLNAIPYLLKEGIDFKIIIAGEYNNIIGGSVIKQLRDLIEKYKDYIIFTGFLSQKELCEFYSAIDVLVLPSIDPLEAFGLVQVEAMLCGTPVIASDMPGVREVIKITNYGYLSRIKDSMDISEKIIKIYKQKPILDRSKLRPFLPSETMPLYYRELFY